MMVDRSSPKNMSKYNVREAVHSNWKRTWENRFARFLSVITLVAVATLITWQIYLNVISQNYLGFYESISTLGNYNSYAVSTDGAHCAKVGAKLLAKNGSAVDAAIGTLLCMGIVIPNSMGLGGGCLMTIYDSKKKIALSINGRETAPHYAHEDMFHGNGSLSSRGPLSVGVPGELAAYRRAHDLYGKLDWKDLFEDAIEMAQNGIPMVKHMSDALRNPMHAKYMSKELKEMFMNKTTKELYKTGDLYKMEKLAETLKRIRDSKDKDDEFYKGTTGQLFVDDLRRQGGNITMEDLRNYSVRQEKAMSFNLTDDLTLYTQPLPGSGIVLSIILRLMQEKGHYYGQRKLSQNYVSSAKYYHHLIESFKFAYSQRAGLEDNPDDPERLRKLMDKLESYEFINSTAHKIDDNMTQDSKYYAEPEEFGQDSGTAHVSVLDQDGLAVAATTSINLYFGSGLVSKSTGIIYNDIMDDFVLPNVINKFGIRPSKYNRIRPGRRPISSMAPSVYVDKLGRVRLIVGASGGTHITTGIASVSLRHLYLGEDIKQAIDARRLHHQFLPNEIVYEKNFPDVIIESLEERNHTCKQLEGRPSIVMAVANQPDADGNNHITANSDGRKGGAVDGY